MLKLMYITNRCEVARIAQAVGVDRIFVDMEYIGKAERQGGMDTVQNHHTVKDVEKIKNVLDASKLLVRINPIYEKTQEEIDSVISAGADLIMLPMWKSAAQAEEFINAVGGRARTVLLLENQSAVECLDDVLKLDGVDEIHIGLNDLSLSMKKRFLFELLADGTVENIVSKISQTNIPYGFGGFGRIGGGTLPAELIVSEHYRLGSSMSILSRAFCNSEAINDLSVIQQIFEKGIYDLRNFENKLKNESNEFFVDSHNRLVECVNEITKGMK